MCACFRGSGVSGQPISSGLIWSERNKQEKGPFCNYITTQAGRKQRVPWLCQKKVSRFMFGVNSTSLNVQSLLMKHGLTHECCVWFIWGCTGGVSAIFFPHHLLKFTCQVSSNLTFINSSQCCSSVHPFADTIWSSCWSTYKICCRTHVLSRGICYATV